MRITCNVDGATYLLCKSKTSELESACSRCAGYAHDVFASNGRQLCVVLSTECVRVGTYWKKHWTPKAKDFTAKTEGK